MGRRFPNRITCRQPSSAILARSADWWRHRAAPQQDHSGLRGQRQTRRAESPRSPQPRRFASHRAGPDKTSAGGRCWSSFCDRACCPPAGCAETAHLAAESGPESTGPTGDRTLYEVGIGGQRPS